MMDRSDYEFCSKFYIVEKTIEVVVHIGSGNRQVRIEALYG